MYNIHYIIYSLNNSYIIEKKQKKKKMHVRSVERRLTVWVLDDVGGRQSWADLREREREGTCIYIYASLSTSVLGWRLAWLRERERLKSE